MATNIEPFADISKSARPLARRLPTCSIFAVLEISYVDSKYNQDYSIVGVGETTFDIRLTERPEILKYDTDNTNKLKYSTLSKNDIGPINQIQLVSGGFGYKSTPEFVSVASTQGISAKLLPESSESNKITDVEILNVGFEYASDKTLRPIANLSPAISFTA